MLLRYISIKHPSHCSELNLKLVGGLVAMFGIFPYINWVSNHPKGLLHFSEGWLNHQPLCWID